MTDREKLIALLRVPIYPREGVDPAECVADYLLDMGVVVREKGAAAAVMKRLLDGEWVETQEVEAALGITFSAGMKLFDFGRTAEWNPAPLNGQKITTMFKLNTSEEAKRQKAFWEQYETSTFSGYDRNHEPKWAARKFYRCERCRKGSAVKSNFCPNCGADMRKGENE